MDWMPFLRHAGIKDHECRSIDVAQIIHDHATPKEVTDHRTSDLDDGALLPTRALLKSILLDNQFKKAKPGRSSEDIQYKSERFDDTDTLEDLLGCECRFCGPARAHHPPEKTTSSIRNGDVSLEDIGALILSGCAFAIPLFCTNRKASLEQFSLEVSRPSASHLHQTLWPDSSVRERMNFYQELRQAVQYKLWIFRIPVLSTQEVYHFRQHTFRHNLPFYNIEHSTTKPRENISLAKCRLLPEYCKGVDAQDMINRTLFRKSVTCSLPPQNGHTTHEDEVETLLQLRNLKDPSILDVSFTIREDISDTQCIVHLIFPYSEDNLYSYLHEQDVKEVISTYGSLPGPASRIFSHKLWTCLSIFIRSVDRLHSYHARDDAGPGTQTLGNSQTSGHMFASVYRNIKLENIAVDRGTGRLLLTDFGNADWRPRKGCLHDLPNFSYDYAAPELTEGMPFHKNDNRRYASDVWSLACVLLETLIYLEAHSSSDKISLSGRDAVQKFRSERCRGSHGGSEVAAFWRLDEHNNVVLCNIVQTWLQHFLNKKHDDIGRVASTIKTMMHSNPLQRPTVQGCLQGFEGTGLVSHSEFRDVQAREIVSHHEFLEGYTQLMAPASPSSSAALAPLSSMSTTFSMEPSGDHKVCSLELWRHNEKHHRLTMYVNRPGALHSKDGDRSLDFLIPISFYQNSEQDDAPPSSAIECRFRDLHQGMTLHFTEPKEFCMFFALMTYQRILPIDDGRCSEELIRRRHNIRLNLCCLVNKRPLIRDKMREYHNGRVQVWRTMSSGSYERIFADGQEGVRMPSQPSIYKLAIFAGDRLAGKSIAETTMASTRPSSSVSSTGTIPNGTVSHDSQVLLVMAIDPENVTILRPIDRSSLVLQKSGSGMMPIYIFRAASNTPGGYPGVPLDPMEVTRKLCHKGEDVDRVIIKFRTASERDLLVRILRLCGHPRGIRDLS